MATNQQPRLLSQQMVREALRDAAFFAVMPEFTQLKARAKGVYGDSRGSAGCSDCDKKREEPNLIRQFVDIALVLAKGRASELCNYFGGTPLLVSGTHPRTRQHVHVTLQPT